jgi:hypothetical protein
MGQDTGEDVVPIMWPDCTAARTLSLLYARVGPWPASCRWTAYDKQVSQLKPAGRATFRSTTAWRCLKRSCGDCGSHVIVSYRLQQ